MAEVFSDHPKWLIFILLVICTKCSYANSNFNGENAENKFIDFEQMKLTLFNSNIAVEFKDKELKPNDQKCLNELEAIQKGLKEFDPWALKSKFFIFLQFTLSSVSCALVN